MFEDIHYVVATIPRGTVSSYGAVARAAGYPGAARQVVWALRTANALPWHRVVGAEGKILLPGEAGVEQRMRLEIEGVRFSGGRVRMEECEHYFDEKVLRGRGRTRRTTEKRTSVGKMA